MPRYSFVTVWELDAPVERVWDAINKPEDWPRWWKYVAEVQAIAPGDEHGVGAVRRFTWRTALPYRFSFDMTVTRVEKLRCIEGLSRGELEGTGRWDLTPSPGGEATTVRYTWEVSTRKGLLNVLAPVARPLFEWNHDIVMRAGGEGLARLVGNR